MISIKGIDDIITMRNSKLDNNEKMIQKALDRGLGMLHLSEFADVIGFDITRDVSLTMLWDTFQDDIPIYITNDLVRLFGYSGELSEQRRKLGKLIAKYKIPIISFTNKEYNEFLGTSHDDDTRNLYPMLDQNTRANAMNRLIMPDDLKNLLLVVNTDVGSNARKYSVALNKLFKFYNSYQSKYEKNIRLLTEKLNTDLHTKMNLLLNTAQENKEILEATHETLAVMNSKLDKATNERAPRTINITKHDVFVLIKSNNPECDWPYYAIRCQSIIINGAISKRKKINPDQEVLLRINYQPNSKNLFNLIKEDLIALKKIEVSGNNITLLGDYSEDQFIRSIKEIDQAKKDVENDEV